MKDTGKHCVADLGSNSFKLEIGEISRAAYIQHHLSKIAVGVGDDMSRSGAISPAKLVEIEAALRDFQETCRAAGLLLRYAVATAAFREARNADAVRKVARRLGISLEIASAERESELAYLAATLGEPDYAVADLGSRTLELVTYGGASGYFSNIFQLGYRVSYRSFFETAGTFLEAAEAYRGSLARMLRDAAAFRGKRKLLGLEIGEAARYLRPDARSVDGVELTAQELARKIEELSAHSAADFAALKRESGIDRILPRLVLLEHIAKISGYPSITVVDRELGAGVIAELSRID